MTRLSFDHIVVGDISDFAGGVVNDLAPGFAHRDHGQLVSGAQPANGLGGLTGLRPQAHAVGSILVQGIGGRSVALRGAECSGVHCTRETPQRAVFSFPDFFSFLEQREYH